MLYIQETRNDQGADSGDAARRDRGIDRLRQRAARIRAAEAVDKADDTKAKPGRGNVDLCKSEG